MALDPEAKPRISDSPPASPGSNLLDSEPIRQYDVSSFEKLYDVFPISEVWIGGLIVVRIERDHTDTS
jgi:hypothetical protein